MPMFNLIEYSGGYSRTFGSLRQHHRDEQALNNAGNIIDFLADNNNNSVSAKFKEKISGQTSGDG